MLSVVSVASYLVDYSLLIDLPALELFCSQDSVVLSVHVVIPLAIVYVAVRFRLWMVVIFVIVLRVWRLPLQIMGLTLLAWLALHKVRISFSLLGLVWVKHVFMLQLHSTFLYYTISISQKQMIWHVIGFSSNLVCQYSSNLSKAGSFKLLSLLQKVRMEFCVSGYRVYCVFDHIMLLILRKFTVEIVRVDCRHEDNSIVIDWVVSKVRVVPDSDLSFLVKSN